MQQLMQVRGVQSKRSLLLKLLTMLPCPRAPCLHGLRSYISPLSPIPFHPPPFTITRDVGLTSEPFPASASC
jgi:hypothetical protein